MTRGMLADRQEIVPGWYWVRDQQDDDVADALVGTAARSTDPSTLAGVYHILGMMSAPLPKKKDLRQKVVNMALSEDALIVKAEVVEYLGLVAAEDDLKLVNEAVEAQPSLRATADAIVQKVLWRVNPNAALIRLLEQSRSRLGDSPPDVPPGSISSETLRQALHHSTAKLRAFAIRELGITRDLQLSEALELANDDSVEVVKALAQAAKRMPSKDRREVGLRLLERLQEGRQGDLTLTWGDSEIRSGALRLLRSSDLEKNLEWYNIYAPDAYKILALRQFAKLGDVLRSDLTGGFERIRSEYHRDFSKKLVDDLERGGAPVATVTQVMRERSDVLLGDLVKYDDFIRERFSVAALEALAVKGSRADAAIVRVFLDSDERSIRFQAVRAIATTGSKDDVNKLIDIAMSDADDSIRLEAIRGAQTLGAGTKIRTQLLDHDDVRIVMAALNGDWGPPPSKKQIANLLRHPNADIRKSAVNWAVTIESREGLERLLDSYLGGESYFYNVVVWIDRMLFSPPRLRRAFRAQLRLSS